MALPPRQPILLVEDDADSRTMLTLSLEFAGYVVVTATNGAEAYNMARQHQPVLILLDLMMPVMTGEEFRRVQVANPEIRKIPVIILSAHHECHLIAKRLKAVGSLAKPVDLDALAAVIRRFVPP